MILENNTNAAKWQTLLKEEFNVTDAEKLSWVSEYAAGHEVYESANIGVNAQAGAVIPGAAGPVGPVYATPLNTLGMGNPMAPNGGVAPMPTQAGFFGQTRGSGDIPVSTLPMALNVALSTIGLELVNVVNAHGPWALLSYMDFPYAGGKLGLTNETAFDGVGEGTENKPIYVKIAGAMDADSIKALQELKAGDEVTVEGDGGTVEGLWRGFTRMDGYPIVEVKSCKNGDVNVSLNKAIAGDVTIAGATIVAAKPDFVETMSDFMDGFANFHGDVQEDGTIKTTTRPMTRAENETGTGNTIGLRLFSQWVQMGAYEVTGTVTRQQLQDLPLYGVDAVSKIMEAMQNELTQHINARILEHVFALGVTNAVQQKRRGTDFNLYIGDPGTTEKNFSEFSMKNFVGVDGVDYQAAWGPVANAESNSSAENLHTRQRRIMSRILAAANVIMVTGRRGKPSWVVTNAQIASALQDISGYVVAPMANTLSQDSANLFKAGTVAGLSIYVDPYMAWDDNRICVGSKKEVGTIFMPYILADTVSITTEGTMAPKMLVNSRFAIVDAGFYPESQYITFAVQNDYGII